MKYVLFALLAWFLYKLVFKFIIPIYKTTRQIKKGFRQMQEKMKEQYQQQQAAQPSNRPAQEQQKPLGDYIDYEEVK